MGSGYPRAIIGMVRWVAVLVMVVAGCGGQTNKPRPLDQYSVFERRLITNHRTQASDALAAGSHDDAARHYDWLRIHYPEVVTASDLAGRAAVYVSAGDFDAGLMFVDEVALVQFPGAPRIVEQRARLLWGLERTEDAVHTAERVVAREASRYEAQLIVGAYYFSRDSARAAIAFKAYLDHRPAANSRHDGMPRLKLGLSYLDINEPEQAEKQFEIARKQFRNDESIVVNALNGLCAAYAANLKFDRAITVCEQIIANPKHLDRKHSAFYNLGRSYLARRRAADAAAAAKEYLAVHPKSEKAWVLLADANFEAGLCDELRAAAERAVELGAGPPVEERFQLMQRRCRPLPPSASVPPPQPSPTGEGVER